MFEVLFHKKTQKSYDKISEKTVRKFNKAIEDLRTNPFIGKDIKKLRGKLTGKYRLRIGNLRVIYRVEKDENIILIESIGRRGNIY